MDVFPTAFNWVRFSLFHPELFIRKPEATNVAGVVEFNKLKVDKFLEFNCNILINHEYTSI